MQIGWAEIFRTLIGGVLLYLAIEGIKWFFRRRKSREQRNSEAITQIENEIKKYERWHSNKIDFLLSQVATLALTLFIACLFAAVFAAGGGMYLLVKLTVDSLPNAPGPAFAPSASLVFLFIESAALVSATSGVFVRISRVVNFENYKEQLEERITEIKTRTR